MAFSCEKFESHPGVPLKEHLKTVGKNARKTLEEQGISDPSLLEVAEIIGKTHDFGKYTQFFQQML
ncbi:MAG: hypothetical protein RMJ39_10455, partial [Deltaproteobacteria bacterium]|nr:hypothetical protein [Deltaproteobacteria bacterium]